MTSPHNRQDRFDVKEKISKLINDMPEIKLMRLLKTLENEPAILSKRLCLRKPFSIPIRCIGAGQITTGIITNMGKNGLFVESFTPIPIGREIMLHFSVLNFEIPVQLYGKIVWACDRGMGIRFLHTPTSSCRLAAQKVADAVNAPPFTKQG